MHGEQAVNPIDAYIYFDILCKGSAKVVNGKMLGEIKYRLASNSVSKGKNRMIQCILQSKRIAICSQNAV